MSGQIDYRARLTEAIDGFLEGIPSSIARAHDIIRSCRESLGSFTMKSLIWDPIVAPLTDSIWYEDKENLLALQQELGEDAHLMGRAFLRYNFVDEFTSTEHDWLTKLSEMLTFLLPFPEIDVAEAMRVYERLCAELQEVCGQVAPVDELGDLTTYRLVLQEVTEIVTNIAMKISVIPYRYPIPRAPYADISDSDTPPDLTSALNWSLRAIRAISGDNTLLITWQIGPGPEQQYVVSLH